MSGGFANMNGGGFASKPRALMCYICGREYGTTSLQIHLKTCMKKWEIEEGKKPKKERRPMPQPPKQLMDVFDKLNGGGKVDYADLDSYNTKANDEYNDSALIRCDYCNRTFLPDRLPIHRKICTPDKPFKPLPPPGGASSKPAQPSYTSGPSSKPAPSSNSYRGGAGGASGGGYGNSGSGYNDNDDGYSAPSSTKASSTRPMTQSKPATSSKPGVKQPPSKQYQQEEEEDFYKAAKTNIQAKKQTYGGGGGYSGGGAVGGEYENLNLVPCSLCGRSFAADRLDRHQKACTKVQKGEAKHAKKVAVAQKKMAEVEKFIEKEQKFKKNNWREQHNEFVANLKYNRKLKAVEDRGGDVRSLGPAPEMKAMQSNLVDCPYCTRRFNPQVAERHIPACKNIINKPKAVPGKGSVPSRTTAQPSYGSPNTKVGGSKAMGGPSYGGNSYGNSQYDDYEPSYGQRTGTASMKSNPVQKSTGSLQSKPMGSQYGGTSNTRGGGFGVSSPSGNTRLGTATQPKTGQYSSPANKKPTGSRYY